MSTNQANILLLRGVKPQVNRMLSIQLANSSLYACMEKKKDVLFSIYAPSLTENSGGT